MKCYISANRDCDNESLMRPARENALHVLWAAMPLALVSKWLWRIHACQHLCVDKTRCAMMAVVARVRACISAGMNNRMSGTFEPMWLLYVRVQVLRQTERDSCAIEWLGWRLLVGVSSYLSALFEICVLSGRRPASGRTWKRGSQACSNSLFYVVWECNYPLGNWMPCLKADTYYKCVVLDNPTIDRGIGSIPFHAGPYVETRLTFGCCPLLI